MAETFTPPTDTAYPAVFDIVRTWLGLAEFRAERAVLDSLARNIAADMCRRDLAPAAYGDKRRPHYTHAAIGIDGVSVNLCFRDGSAEFVFREEELDFIREDGRDLYVAHIAASEVLSLRQSLIDYLPAAEGVEDRAVPVGQFQARVQPWLMACFGEMIAGDREERNHRFLEEALELVQACSCTADEAHQLVDYVFGRPAGEKGQEVGGVMVTLAALCLAQGLDLHDEAETELARIWTKVEQICAKQAAKPKYSPLPEHALALAQGEAARG